MPQICNRDCIIPRGVIIQKDASPEEVSAIIIYFIFLIVFIPKSSRECRPSFHSDIYIYIQ